MPTKPWYPYPPDQQFGVRGAADEAAVDHLIALWEAGRAPAPRAGNKAPLAAEATSSSPPASGGRPRFEWSSSALLAAGATDGPVTTATALDAATLVGRGWPTDEATEADQSSR